MAELMVANTMVSVGVHILMMALLPGVCFHRSLAGAIWCGQATIMSTTGGPSTAAVNAVSGSSIPKVLEGVERVILWL